MIWKILAKNRIAVRMSRNEFFFAEKRENCIKKSPFPETLHQDSGFFHLYRDFGSRSIQNLLEQREERKGLDRDGIVIYDIIILICF